MLSDSNRLTQKKETWITLNTEGTTKHLYT